MWRESSGLGMCWWTTRFDVGVAFGGHPNQWIWMVVLYPRTDSGCPRNPGHGMLRFRSPWCCVVLASLWRGGSSRYPTMFVGSCEPIVRSAPGSLRRGLVFWRWPAWRSKCSHGRMPMFRDSVFPPYVSIVEPLAACSLSGVGLADGSIVWGMTLMAAPVSTRNFILFLRSHI